ncbi:MAG: hypothetical protein ACRD3W_31995 [Terriglobales bacterium]
MRIEQLESELAKTQEQLQQSENSRAVISATFDQLKEHAAKAEQIASKSQAERDTAMTETAHLRGQIEALTLQNKDLLSRLSGTSK